MTLARIHQKRYRRPSQELELAGDASQQNAALKRLLRELARIERTHLAETRKVRVTIKALARGVDALRGDSRGAQRALRVAMNLAAVDEIGGNVAVNHSVCELLGTDSDYVAWELLCGRDPYREDVDDTVPVTNQRIAPSSTPQLSAESALEAAMRIARDAEDAAIEIDWAENPASEREAQLRLAIIRQIEAEAADSAAALRRITQESDDAGESAEACWSASFTLTNLRKLEPDDAEEIGADLYDAIERWVATHTEARKRHAEIKRKRLVDAARQDLGNTPTA
jgi:hypothetical protein